MMMMMVMMVMVMVMMMMIIIIMIILIIIIIVIVVILQPFAPISHNRMGILDDGVGQFYAQRNSRMAARPNVPSNGVELRVAYQYMPKPLQTGDEAKLATVLKENLRLGLAYEANDAKKHPLFFGGSPLGRSPVVFGKTSPRIGDG
jgi:hypothetical protein